MLLVLVILSKNLKFIYYYHFLPRVNLTDNVLQLGEVAEIEAQMFSFAQKFNRRTAVEFITEPAILPNCCCVLCFTSFAICLVIIYLFLRH